MQNEWSLGRWGKLPVTMHWTVLMAFPWLFLMMNDLLASIIGSVAFFGLLVAHEYGHVLAARWRRVPVYSIALNGLHGETGRAHAPTLKDQVIIAWGGVTAQLLVMVLAYGLAGLLVQLSPPDFVWTIVAPLLQVFTRWNVFLIIIALLPIGPMDGHEAWKIFTLARTSAAPARGNGKVAPIDPARRRALEQDSAKKVTDILERMKRK